MISPHFLPPSCPRCDRPWQVRPSKIGFHHSGVGFGLQEPFWHKNLHSGVPEWVRCPLALPKPRFDRGGELDTIAAPSPGTPPTRLARRDLNNPTLVLILAPSLCVAFVCASSLVGKLQPPAQTSQPAPAPLRTAGQVITGVRTTAYTHSEADHIQYGARSAVGTPLRAGQIRSAAADWSIYPLGTVFQIQGDPSVYVVDDYGSALVGTRTIDLYQPTASLMNRWGTRKVNIRVLRWGSPAKSLAVLKPRAYKASHVREMISRIQGQTTAG